MRIVTAREQVQLLGAWRKTAGSLSLDWQDLSHEGPIGPAEDRISKTGEPWHSHQATTEAGDTLTVANSARHPNTWGYTLWANDDLNNDSGIKWDGDGGFDSTEPLGEAGHNGPEPGFKSPQEAMIAAEQHYFSLDHAGRSRGNSAQDSGFDYDSFFNKKHAPIDDDFGDIFGGG